MYTVQFTSDSYSYPEQIQAEDVQVINGVVLFTKANTTVAVYPVDSIVSIRKHGHVKMLSPKEPERPLFSDEELG